MKRIINLGGWFWLLCVLTILNAAMFLSSFHWYNMAAGLLATFAAVFIAWKRWGK